MKHTEYIIPIGEDAQDYDEMFIGVIRRQPELVRCKDCEWLGVANLKDKYGQPNPVPCCRGNGNIRIGIKPDDYCSRAERKEE